MALIPKDLGGNERAFASSPRLQVFRNKSVKFAADAGDVLYLPGFPVAESTTPGTYEPWNQVGEALGRKLVGFVPAPGVQSISTGEVLGVLATEGQVHRDDVILPAGELQADLDAALRDSDLKSRGWHVQGLEDVSL